MMIFIVRFKGINPFKEGWTSQDWLRVEKMEEGKKRNQSIDWLRFGRGCGNQEITAQSVSAKRRKMRCSIRRLIRR